MEEPANRSEGPADEGVSDGEEESSVIVVLEDELRDSSESLSDDLLRSTVSFFIPDAGGRALWSAHFLNEAEVAFERFSKALRSYGGKALTDEQYHLLEQFEAQLLGGKFDEQYVMVAPVVTLERFGQISWLFPHANLKDTLLAMETLARSSWFFGAVSLEDAHEAICRQPKGSFLVRIGQGISTGSLSVSRVIDPMTVLHSRLYYNHSSSQWAIKTRKSSSNHSGLLTSPRVTAVSAQSMVAAVEKRRALRAKVETRWHAL